MEQLRSKEKLRDWVGQQKQQGLRIGLVPTMGALHAGHLSLIREARQHADVVLVTLFVNPTQFAPNEDLDSYPRTWEADVAACESEGAAALFAPEVNDMYEGDASVTLIEDRLSRGLCGRSRPTHFSGVLTIVLKLFNLSQPDVAVFGEKDAQQIRLIRRMVRDLDVPVRIVGAPIIREADGLAMSSRNRRLSPESRQEALRIVESLRLAETALAGGERDPAQLRQLVHTHLERASRGTVDYVELVDDESLEPLNSAIEGPALLAVALLFPEARLIDNLRLLPDS